jgi:hypothetical protein
VKTDLKEELKAMSETKSGDMPKMDHIQFCKQMLSRIKLSSLIMPTRYLKITEEEWNHIKYLAQCKMEREMNGLAELKEQLWGKRLARTEGMEDGALDEEHKEFYQMYRKIYSDASGWLQSCISNIETEFECFKKEGFDRVTALFNTKHKDDVDEFTMPTVNKENLTLEERYQRAVKYQNEQEEKLRLIVEKFNIKLVGENEIPKPVRHLMTCELKNDAYQDLYKKGIFFGDQDLPKKFMNARVEAINQAVSTLD